MKKNAYKRKKKGNSVVDWQWIVTQENYIR